MSKIADRVVEALRRWKRFVLYDAWLIGRPGEEPPGGLLIKHVRVAILLLQNLGKNAMLLRAAALAFASLLAIVPFLAITFFVIETFKLDKELYAYVAQALQVADAQYAEAPALPDSVGAPETPAVPPQMQEAARAMAAAAAQYAEEDTETMPEPEDLPLPPPTPPADGAMSTEDMKRQVAEFFLRIYVEGRQEKMPGEMSNPVEAIVEFAKRGENPQTIGLAGIIFVVTTVFGLMMNIEAAFHQIWGLKDTRSWYRMFSDYLVIVLFLPFFVATMVSLMAVLHHSALHLPLSQTLVYRGAQHMAVWLSFTLLYIVVPKANVRIRYALLGGIVAGTLWNLLTWLYISFQYGLSNYSLLYSTFAQFPVLLMWVYFSWVIVLFGAELTFAYQNEKTFALERYADKASYAYREALGLRTLIEAARRFDRGLPGLVAEEAVREWNVPLRLLNALLAVFEEARLLVSSTGPPVRYQPAQPTDKVTVGDVLTALREAGCDPTALRDDEHFRPLLERLENSHDGFLNLTLRELASREPAVLVLPPPREPAPAVTGPDNGESDSTRGR